MAAKSKKRFLLSIVNKLVTIPLMLSLLSHLFHMIKVEMIEAKQSIARLLLLMMCLFILLFSVWGCLLVLLFYYLQTFHLSAASSVVILLGFTLVMLVLVLYGIKRSEKHLLFLETRKLLSHLVGE